MIPANGKFTYISYTALGPGAVVVPAGTTHCVFGTAAYSDHYGILAAKFDGTNTLKVAVPLGTFMRLANIIPGTTTVLTDGNAPASSVTNVTFYKWEQEP